MKTVENKDIGYISEYTDRNFKIFKNCNIDVISDKIIDCEFINCTINDICLTYNVDIQNCSFIKSTIKNGNLDCIDYLDRKTRDGLKRSKQFQVPDGHIIGYKKLKFHNICKLLIPADAKRSNAFSRKCRAEYAFVLEGAGFSSWDDVTHYKKHTFVYPDKFDYRWYHECSSGIHFFMTQEEAEAY